MCKMKKIFLFIAVVLCITLASHTGFVYGDNTMKQVYNVKVLYNGIDI